MTRPAKDNNETAAPGRTGEKTGGKHMDVYTASNTVLTLTEPPLSSGGEGAVYSIHGYPDRVAKIYHDPADAQRREGKITAMVNIRQGSGFQRSGLARDIAWPMAALYDSRHRFIGFGMQRIAADTELDDLYVYPPEGRPISIQNRVNILIHLCDVIDRLHTSGQVFGDFNPNNIKVKADGTVNFVDADSYHIHNAGQEYRCVVCAPGYVAPEVLRACKGSTYADCPGVTFTENSDNFALAIHIFRMLMNGCHPFICERHLTRAGSAPAPKSTDKRVESGETPFFKTIPNYTTPHYAPDLNAFPPYLRDLFRRAFVDGHTNPDRRPRAADWKRALTRFGGELTKCRHGHFYWNGAQSCPYCEADARHKKKMAQALSPGTVQPIVVPRVTYSTAPAQPNVTVAPPPTSRGELGFWLVTLLVSLAIQILLAIKVFPSIYASIFESPFLVNIGVCSSVVAGLYSCWLYNTSRTAFSSGRRFAWWEYMLSILLSVVASAAAAAALALAALILHGFFYIFLIILIFCAILSIL